MFIQIGFEGSRGTNIEGDISIDNVRITSGTCEEGPSSDLFYCDFDSNTECAIQQRTDDIFNWIINSGSTPTVNTGPSLAQSLPNYWYMEATGRQTGANAVVEIPPLGLTGPVCLSFWYHMWGLQQGILYVYTTRRTIANPWNSIFGNKGNQWFQEQVDIQLQTTDDRIGFYGQIGGDTSDTALDNIRVTRGTCTGVTPAPPTAYSVPYACDYDVNDLCGLTQATNDRFDWQLYSGSTPTPGTGPTGAQSGNYYIYAEADGRSQGDTAIGMLPALNYVGTVCLSFYYYKSGINQGVLTVDSTERSGPQPWGTFTGNSGDQWVFQRTTVTLNSVNDMIEFVAAIGNGIYSDIAVDNVRVDAEACPGDPPPSSIPYACDFNFNDICGITQSNNDQFDFTLYSGATPTSSTGPTQAYSGLYYMYAEADGRNPGDTAIIELPPLNYVGSVCLTYFYHIWGSSQGALIVYTTERTLSNSLRTLVGNQGNQWIQDRISIDLLSANDRIAFYVQRGNDIYSDIAVDNIRVDAGNCPGTEPPPSNDLPYSCDFNFNDVCGIIQEQNSDRFDWTLFSGSTPTIGTGPTSAQSGNYYYYAEADGRLQGDHAAAYLPAINYVGSVCVRYYYYISGVNMGSLSLFTTDRSINDPWQSINGDRGAQWLSDSVTVDLRSAGDRIGFSARIGNGIFSDVAIDNIQVTQGSCQGLPYACDFSVNDLCNMQNEVADSFDWIVFTGSTPTFNTGPVSAQSGPYYIYMEANGRFPGDTAVINMPSFSYIGRVCLSFYYHMWGSQQGVLYVASTNRPLPNYWQRYSGDKGNQWNFARLTVDLTSTNDRISFYGQRGSGDLSDIAVDNVRVDIGDCITSSSTTPTPTTPSTTPMPPVVDNVPYECSFENNNFCGMTQRTNDNFDWTATTFSTETSDTGPDRAASGDWYAYTEASFPRQIFDRTYLDTPSLQYSGPVCVRFWYYMYGVGIGRLIVFQSSRGEGSPLFIQSGATGRQWIPVSRDVTLVGGEQISFLGELGGNSNVLEYGDIAIDDLRIERGSCSLPPVITTPAPGPPTDGPEKLDYYTCNMESNGQSDTNCRIRNRDTQDSPGRDWLMNTGRTPSAIGQNRDFVYPVTGPENAFEGNTYLYAEATGTAAGDITRLILEGSTFQRGGDNCLRFMYSMNGFNTGTLRVYMKQNNGNALFLWSMTGDQKFDWYRTSVDVNGDGLTELGIEAIMTGEFNSDIAIDDLRYDSGPCQAYIWLCNFELNDGSSTMCQMTQDVNDQYDWTLWKGPTPSDETGPAAAFNGQWYIFAEGSKPRVGGERARILTPSIDYSGDMCLEFYYNMDGFHMGTLEVYITDQNGNTRDGRVWAESGDKGTPWLQGRTSLTGFQFRDKVAFQAVVGVDYSTDLGLDNIRLSIGRC